MKNGYILCVNLQPETFSDLHAVFFLLRLSELLIGEQGGVEAEFFVLLR